AGSASVGAVEECEGLTTRNVGRLEPAGPATGTMLEVSVEGGVLDVAGAGSVAGVQTTTVHADATLNVDGTYAGTAGGDAFTVSGTVSGTGAIALGDGDDVLRLEDEAVLAAAIDGGGAASADTLVLDTASSLTLDGGYVSGFEQLVKENTGTARLAGTHAYDGTAITGGTLAVDGSLETGAIALADGAALAVSGDVQGAGGAQTAVTGTAGINTVVVAAGATLVATGDLGAGDDVLDVAGTLDIGGGDFDLGAGDDTFVVRDGTRIVGTVVGGDGHDTRLYDIDLAADIGALSGFEGLTKTGAGVLNLDGPGSSDVTEVEVRGGTLNVAANGGIRTVASAVVGAGATLNVDGTLDFTAGADVLTVAGAVTGAGTIDLLDGDDELVVRDGADLASLANALDGGAGNDMLTADITTSAALGGEAGFETLAKQSE